MTRNGTGEWRARAWALERRGFWAKNEPGTYKEEKLPSPPNASREMDQLTAQIVSLYSVVWGTLGITSRRKGIMRGIDGVRLYRQIRNSAGMTLELLDQSGSSMGTFVGVKNRHNGRECYQFAAEDQLVLRAQCVRVKASGDTFPISEVKARVFGDAVAWYDAFVEPVKTAPGQTFVFRNATIGQFNAATGNITVVNEAAFGGSAEDIRRIIEAMKVALDSSNDLSADCRADAMEDIEGLVREAQRPTPRAERLLGYLGHINNIAGLAGLAGQLGSILAKAGFGGS
jgi:hypothetical protein